MHPRRLWATAVALILSSLSASAQPAAPTGPSPTAPSRPAVAATVNGQPVLESAVQRALRKILPERQAEARAELLNYLIENALLDQYLAGFKIKVEKAEIDKKLEEIKAELKKAQNKDLDKFLAEEKLSEPELREHIQADLRWEKFAVGQATDAALKSLFESNKQMFDGSQVHALHILLTPTDVASEAGAVAKLRGIKQEIETAVAAELAKLPQGSDTNKERLRLTQEKFAARAKEISACPSGKANGGDVGTFYRGEPMVEAFAQAAFSLQPCQISDAVKSQFGYHLILVVERKPGRDVTLDMVKEQVKEVYFEKLREAIVAQMRPKARVEIAPPMKP